MWLIKILNEDGRWGSGMRRKDLENQSITTRIVALPWDTGRSLRKSKAKWDHEHCRMGRGKSFPAGRVRVTLAWAQDGHEDTTCCISERMLGHQYFSISTWNVHWVTGWPVANSVWPEEVSWVRKWLRTKSLLGGQLVGICCLGVQARTWWKTQLIAPTKQDEGRTFSSVGALFTMAWRCDNATALVFFEPGQ